MPNQALSFGTSGTLSAGGRRENRAKTSISGTFSMQDQTSSSSLENAIALQKFGVGQPVRRKEDDTLVRGKGKYTDDFNLPGQAYAWIVRSSHAHGIIRGIDTAAAKAMPGVLGVWTGTDLAAANYGPFTCGLPLKNRDGTPLLQTNRTALMTDKVRYVGDPVAVRGRRDAGAGARCRRSRGARHRSSAGRHRASGSGQARRAAALRSHPQQRGAGLSLRRHRQGRGRLRRRRPCDQARHRQHPRRRGGDGAARRARLLSTRRASATPSRFRPRASPATGRTLAKKS